jgi:hypothetical protein
MAAAMSADYAFRAAYAATHGYFRRRRFRRHDEPRRFTPLRRYARPAMLADICRFEPLFSPRCFAPLFGC